MFQFYFDKKSWSSLYRFIKIKISRENLKKSDSPKKLAPASLDVVNECSLTLAVENNLAGKAFYRSPKTTFLAYFHVFAGNHQWAYHYNTINPNKDILALGFELNFQ